MKADVIRSCCDMQKLLKIKMFEVKQKINRMWSIGACLSLTLDCKKDLHPIVMYDCIYTQQNLFYKSVNPADYRKWAGLLIFWILFIDSGDLTGQGQRLCTISVVLNFSPPVESGEMLWTEVENHCIIL